MKNLIVRFYIEVATISAIRDTYPVATTTTAEDTAIIIDFNIITPLIEREGYLAFLSSLFSNSSIKSSLRAHFSLIITVFNI